MIKNISVGGIEKILAEGVKGGASDIHIEPLSKKVRVRFRMDGVLVEVYSLPLTILDQLISRIKILSNLDIAEKRLPQDGRFSSNYEGRRIDFRVSILNTIQGEKCVIRILDKDKKSFTLEEMGFQGRGLEVIKEIVGSTQGIILVTGPTGSGKTTTLYTILQLLNSKEKNVVTIEDPVEYDIPGINQIQCKKKINLDFNTILPSILRQDPDIIMVGEIRDEKTANLVVRAGLTGHLVLSTLHTNDARSAIPRLLNMKVEDYLLSTTLKLVIAQRLVRKFCSNCHGKGCVVCKNTGFKGRIVIYEFLKGDTLIGSLVESGMELVRNNITSEEEVKRVVYK